MRRRALIAHLLAHGCEFLREGSNHTIYINRGVRKSTAVPRHREIDEELSAKICKDVDVARPW